MFSLRSLSYTGFSALPPHPRHDELRPETVDQMKPSFLYIIGYFITKQCGHWGCRQWLTVLVNIG